MEFPKRKPTRLKDYDYSTPGAYFVTVCTKNRINYFWHSVGASIARPQDIPLTEIGIVVDKAINNIPKIYNNITVDRYVVMPNHIHLLLQIHSDPDGRPMVAPTIDRVIQQMKGYVTKQIGKPIWQKLFHDHIIRGEEDYNEIWQYIEQNPAKWKEDSFYIE